MRQTFKSAISQHLMLEILLIKLFCYQTSEIKKKRLKISLRLCGLGAMEKGHSENRSEVMGQVYVPEFH